MIRMGNYLFQLKFCFILSLLISICIPGALSSSYVCGKSYQNYNPATHKCVDNKVEPLSSKLNRDPTETTPGLERKCLNMETRELATYDLSKKECKNGTLVDLLTTTTSTKTTDEVKPSTPDYTPSTSSHTERDLPEGACRFDNRGYLPKDYDCCNHMPYKPKDKTCCYRTSSFLDILPGSEHNHVCCWDSSTSNFTLYRRGSKEIPCQHASTNDPLFTKLRSFNPSKVSAEELKQICDKTKYVFRLVIDEANRKSPLVGWAFSKKKKSYISPLPSDFNSIELRKDKHSPATKRPRKRSAMILTEYNHFRDAVFYLKPIDRVYKFPKNEKRVDKTFKKLKRKCHQLNKNKSKSKLRTIYRHKRML